MGQREVVALRKPYGQLDGGAGALAVLPGGVAVLDGKAEKLHLLSRRGWHGRPAAQTVSLKVRKEKASWRWTRMPAAARQEWLAGAA
jgi:3-phytase